MPAIKTDDGCPIHVEVQGAADKPVLMLSSSLGTTHRMWDPHVTVHMTPGEFARVSS
jgi:3-oxoadipate enol-lactonase